MTPLTPTEARIVRLIVCDALSDAEISARLGIASSTLKSHIRNARGKLGGSGSGRRFWVRAAYALGRAEARHD